MFDKLKFRFMNWIISGIKHYFEEWIEEELDNRMGLFERKFEDLSMTQRRLDSEDLTGFIKDSDSSDDWVKLVLPTEKLVNDYIQTKEEEKMTTNNLTLNAGDVLIRNVKSPNGHAMAFALAVDQAAFTTRTGCLLEGSQQVLTNGAIGKSHADNLQPFSEDCAIQGSVLQYFDCHFTYNSDQTYLLECDCVSRMVNVIVNPSLEEVNMIHGQEKEE